MKRAPEQQASCDWGMAFPAVGPNAPPRDRHFPAGLGASAAAFRRAPALAGSPRARARSRAVEAVVLAAAGVAAACAVAWSAASFDTVLVLAGLVGATGAVVMLIRPELATLFVVFVLYLNIPAALTQRHGIPEAVAGGFILLLASPLMYRLMVRREQPLFDAPFLLMVAFLGVMLLSALLSARPALSVMRVQGFVLEGLLLYWLLVNSIDSERTLRRVLSVLLAAGALLAVLSLYQHVTGDYRQEFGGLAYRDYADPATVAPGEKRGRDWHRAQGPVNEPNRFGQILLVLVPFSAFLFRNVRSRLTRLVPAAAGLAVLIGIALTLSRGTFIALAVVAIAMVWFRWVRASRLVAAGVALSLALPVLSPSLIPRIQSIAGVTKLIGGDRAEYQELDGATLGRTTEMLAAFQAFVDHPLLGVGPGLYAPLYSVEYQQKNPDLKFRDLQIPRRAHSLYFEMAAELGAIGLGVFGAIVLLLVRGLWQARARLLERSPGLADLAAALLLSLLAYLATAVTMHLSYQRYYWLLVALASAGLHAIRRLEETDRTQATNPAKVST